MNNLFIINILADADFDSDIFTATFNWCNTT